MLLDATMLGMFYKAQHFFPFLIQERLFVNEDNVDEFLEEVTSPPSKQTKLLTPPLIEVLQITDSKIQIHAEVRIQMSLQINDSRT